MVLEAGDKAPVFTLLDQNGEKVALSKQKGKRVRVETRQDPQYGRIYSVRVWAAQEFRGRNFKIDLIRGR